MSCYTRHMTDMLYEAGLTDTPANRERLDRAVRMTLGVGGEAECPDVLAGVKERREDRSFHDGVIMNLTQSNA